MGWRPRRYRSETFAADVCAVIVTRGDVDLRPILKTLPYGEIRIWNDRERGSRGCYGRYLAANETAKPFVYFQDDDVIFRSHRKLLARHEPNRMVVNMPSPWYEEAGYDRLQQALVGAGSIMERGIWDDAIQRYLAAYPADGLFLTYVDIVVGMLTPHKRHDLGYEVRPFANEPGRIYTTPGAQERKAEVQRRVMTLRGDV